MKGHTLRGEEKPLVQHNVLCWPERLDSSPHYYPCLPRKPPGAHVKDGELSKYLPIIEIKRL